MKTAPFFFALMLSFYAINANSPLPNNIGNEKNGVKPVNYFALSYLMGELGSSLKQTAFTRQFYSKKATWLIGLNKVSTLNDSKNSLTTLINGLSYEALSQEKKITFIGKVYKSTDISSLSVLLLKLEKNINSACFTKKWLSKKSEWTIKATELSKPQLQNQ